MELRQEFEENRDLRIVWVMADNQVNDKTHWFLDGLSLRERVLFAVDPGSAAIDALRIRRPDAEPMEQGVPHPTTYLLDRNGVVRFVDVREDYHIWLDPRLVAETLASLVP